MNNYYLRSNTAKLENEEVMGLLRVIQYGSNRLEALDRLLAIYHLKHQSEIAALKEQLAQLQQPADKWISVKERLPENEDRVLVASSEFQGVMLTTYHYDGKGWLPYGGYLEGYDERITHWQPLPEAPAVNEK